MKEERIFWLIIIGMVITGISCMSYVISNAEPSHTQTITTVDKVIARVDMTNESMTMNQAVNMVLEMKDYVKQLEERGEK